MARRAGVRKTFITGSRALSEHLDSHGLATAIDDRGGRRSGGKRRQRKRAAAEETPLAQVEVAQPDPADDLEALAKAVSVLTAPEPPPLLPEPVDRQNPPVLC